MPTNVHQHIVKWFEYWAGDVRHSTSLPLHVVHETMFSFPNRYFIIPELWRNGLLICPSDKVPDCVLYPDETTFDTDDPTIALEAGYSESMGMLQNDAKVILNGSQGNIKLAILVKIDPPTQPDDKTLHKGTLQVWRYYPTHRRAMYGRITKTVNCSQI